MEPNHSDDNEQLARSGDYFLKRDRNKAGTISIYTCKKVTSASGRTSNQTVPVAPTHTSDPSIAEVALHRFVLNDKEAKQKERERVEKGESPSLAIDRPVLEALNTYFLGHAEKKGGSVRRCVMNTIDAVEGAWPKNPLCSQLDRDRQLEFVDYGRKQGWTDKTISIRLQYVWTAMHWCSTGGRLASNYPKRIRAEQWEANLDSNKEPYTLDELAAFFKAARRAPSRWRYMVCAVATGSRPTAVLELTHKQVDLKHRICRLNPEGRRQTKKRRAVVPMCPTFFHEVTSWGRDHEYLITYNGDRLWSTSFFENTLGPETGIHASPMLIRHTVRTWLAQQRVPDAMADIFVGHAEEGSDTGRRFYKHMKPDYLLDCAEAVEKLFQEIEQRTGIPFAGSKSLTLENQPLPEDPFAGRIAGRIGQVRGNYVPAVFDNVLKPQQFHTAT